MGTRNDLTSCVRACYPTAARDTTGSPVFLDGLSLKMSLWLILPSGPPNWRWRHIRKTRVPLTHSMMALPPKIEDEFEKSAPSEISSIVLRTNAKCLMLPVWNDEPSKRSAGRSA